MDVYGTGMMVGMMAFFPHIEGNEYFHEEKRMWFRIKCVDNQSQSCS